MAGCDYNTGVGSTKPNPATDDFIVFGYSQSAVVASLVKNDLIANPTSRSTAPSLRGLESHAGQRRNLGTRAQRFDHSHHRHHFLRADTEQLFGRGVRSQRRLRDSDRRCRAAVRHPRRRRPARLDPLAFANSIASYALLHGNVPNRSIDGTDKTVIYQDTYGDTDYYLIGPAASAALAGRAGRCSRTGPGTPDALLRV